MNLADELIEVIRRAKASNEYHNPHLLVAVAQAIEECNGQDSVPDWVWDYAKDMYGW